MAEQKPPLGLTLTPKVCFEQQLEEIIYEQKMKRLDDVESAMSRYIAAKKHIPTEWFDEYKNLSRLRESVRNQQSEEE